MPTKITVVEVAGGRLEISATYIAIYHENGDEIVYWDHAEWEEDKDCPRAIVNALILAESRGAQAVCDKIGRCLPCREREDIPLS